jgi:hypothetical protein
VDVAVGVVLALVGATTATLLTRSATRRGPRLALMVAPAGLLIGAGAALARGWDLAASALLGMLAVGVLSLLSGLRYVPPSQRDT